MRRYAAALAGLLALLSCGSARAEGPGCLPPQESGPRLSWFLGIMPGDDLLSAWCRMQALPGAVRFNVNFPVTGAHRSWETSLEGQDIPAQRIVEIVQSLLPVADGPARDADGMAFPRVLSNVVQAAAAETPDGARKIGFPKDHPAARELLLWEPVELRVRPVVLAGREFTLAVTLRPNLGMFALAMQGRATDVRFIGWKGRMPSGGFLSAGCADVLPLCEDLPDAPVFHAPWIVTNASLVADGENMTAAAGAIMSQLAGAHSAFMDGKPQFDPKTGVGTLKLKDALSSMQMTTQGGPSGTSAIRLRWEASTGKGTLAEALENAASTYRASSAPRGADAPAVPDSLGNL